MKMLNRLNKITNTMLLSKSTQKGLNGGTRTIVIHSSENCAILCQDKAAGVPCYVNGDTNFSATCNGHGGWNLN